MNTAYLKFAGAALLFGLWTALVMTGHQDADLIDAIKYALGALGLYHAVSNLQGPQQVQQLVAQLTQQIQSGSAGSVAPVQKLPTVPFKDPS
jgi:hypothetical protein